MAGARRARVACGGGGGARLVGSVEGKCVGGGRGHAERQRRGVAWRGCDHECVHWPPLCESQHPLRREQHKGARRRAVLRRERGTA